VNSKQIYLVDGSSYIYRAYFAIRHLSNSRGEATNAVYGFTNMLLTLMRQEQPDLAAVVFDTKAPTFRKQLYP
jgi:DNA polymerase-1